MRDRDRSRRSFQAAIEASSSWLSMWNFNARSDRNDFEHFRQSYSPISEFRAYSDNQKLACLGRLNLKDAEIFSGML